MKASLPLAKFKQYEETYSYKKFTTVLNTSNENIVSVADLKKLKYY